VRVAQEMSRAIFGDPNRVRLRIESSAHRLPNLLSGSADMVVQAMTATCDRKRRIGMSSVYYDAAQRLAVPAVPSVTSVADLGGRPVCSITGTTSTTTLQAARGAPQDSEPYAIGVPPENTDLLRFTNGVLDRLEADGTWAAIVAATFGGTPAAPPPGQYAG
jgi:polar amino acid transport system substrate-binding protein